MFPSRILTITAATVLSANVATAAVVGVDLSLLSDGSVPDPTVISAGGVDVTFSNPLGNGLQVASGLAGLTSKGICANDTVTLPIVGTLTNECEGPLKVDFSTGIDDLAFTIDGISLLSTTSLAIEYDGGTASYDEFDLLSLSLFGGNILNGEFDLSSFTGVTSVLVQYSALLGVNEALPR